MSVRRFDTLIIGQGLAGSALAWHLIHAGQRVRVFDDGHRSASSRVAAGLINPLAGMRFNRRPELDDWLREADAWYAEIAKVCGGTVYHPLPMLRLFRSPEQQRFYHRRRDDPASRDLLGEVFDPGDCPEPVSAPFGGFVQTRTGYVDLPRLLDGLRAWLSDRDALSETAIQPGELRLDRDAVRVADLAADRLVFCEGARARCNRWFGDLPLAPDKGEILDLVCDDWTPRHIVNGAHWLVPTHDGVIRLGATHGHADLGLATSRAGRQALLDGFAAMAPGVAARVVAHHVGIRPGTRDRYPLLGRNPVEKRLWICNGFGARGALTIPWYTARLAASLLRSEPLPAEADVARFA